MDRNRSPTLTLVTLAHRLDNSRTFTSIQKEASDLKSKLRSLKGGRCNQSARTPCEPELRSQTARPGPKLRPSLSSELDYVPVSMNGFHL